MASFAEGITTPATRLDHQRSNPTNHASPRVTEILATIAEVHHKDR